MNRKIISVLLIMAFFIALGIMDYPYIKEMMNNASQQENISGFQEAVSKMTEADIKNELQKAKKYNDALSNGVNGQMRDAFNSPEGGGNYYNDVLTVNQNDIMAVIDIPKIDLTLPVYHGTNKTSMNEGVGHVEWSSLPVGGKGTHTCLSAHRGLPGKELFTHLNDMAQGDRFYIRVYDRILAYEVYQTEVVLPEEVDNLRIQEGKDIATLITCTPYGINTERIYVHGKRIPYEKLAENADNISFIDMMKYNWWIMATIGLILWLSFLLYMLNRKTKKKDRTNSIK